MSRRDVVLGECLRDFNCAQRTDHAVVVAAFGNAVDVRTKQNWSETVVVVAGRATADDVTRRVDRDVELRALHQAKDVFTAAPIGFTVSETADTALRVLAKFSEGAEVLADARAIHAQFWYRTVCGSKRGTKHQCTRSSQQSETELATIHKRRHTSRKNCPQITQITPRRIRNLCNLRIISANPSIHRPRAG